MGEALVLRKNQRILVFLALKPTLAVLLQSCKRSGGILGGETAKQHLPSAELRDGTRPSVLAFPYTGSPAHAVDVLNFRGRSPSVTKKSTHPSVSSVETHAGSTSTKLKRSGGILGERNAQHHAPRVRVARRGKTSVLALKQGMFAVECWRLNVDCHRLAADAR